MGLSKTIQAIAAAELFARHLVAACSCPPMPAASA
jgi:hypothetical protein